jgi:hypothetical protein
MHARYFASAQGRFSSADSVAGSVGNPQSLNRYAYVNNNPSNLTDPTGHMPSIHTYSSTRDGGGAEWSWDDPNSPQAVLNGLGYQEIGSTQLNDFSAEASQGATASSSGSAIHEAGHSEASNSDNRPLITDMVQPNDGVGTDDNGNYRFHANPDGTSGHDGDHVLGAREGSTISAISGLTGRVLTWYTQDLGPVPTYGVFILLSDQKTVMVLKDVENVSSKVRQAPYGTAPFLDKNGNPISKVFLKAGDRIGSTSKWEGPTNKYQRGMHFGFSHFEFARQYRDNMRKAYSSPSSYFIDPCGSSSPARCR